MLYIYRMYYIYIYVYIHYITMYLYVHVHLYTHIGMCIHEHLHTWLYKYMRAKTRSRNGKRDMVRAPFALSSNDIRRSTCCINVCVMTFTTMHGNLCYMIIEFFFGTIGHCSSHLLLKDCQWLPSPPVSDWPTAMFLYGMRLVEAPWFRHDLAD